MRKNTFVKKDGCRSTLLGMEGVHMTT